MFGFFDVTWLLKAWFGVPRWGSGMALGFFYGWVDGSAGLSFNINPKLCTRQG